MRNKITRLFKVSILILALSLTAVAFAQQWQPPESAPPGSPNVSPPIHVGPAVQTKSGPLGVSGLVVNAQGGNGQICLNGVGAEDCISSWSEVPSDARLKTNLTSISSGGLTAIQRISALNGWFFNWNDLYQKNFSVNKERQVGLIAQDVEKVLPEAVSSVLKNGVEYKTVDYEKLVPLLVEALKEQQSQIESLKLEVESLKK
jgi:hypothetical protein